jgi:hypothetical protein
MSEYGRATGKISIQSLDDGTLVVAQYNPKELQIDRTVPWSPTGEANKSSNSSGGGGGGQSNSGIHLEFTGAQGRSLSVELLFDGYEKGASSGFSVDVAGEVSKLEHLASVIAPGSQLEDKRRPHWCVATWGTSLRAFRCVIESLTTKYTMFDSSGNPLRATCTVKLKEADSVKAKGG